MSSKRKYKTSKTFDDTNPKGGKKEIVKLEHFVDVFSMPKNNKYVQMRLVGPVIASATHWIDIKTKDGKKVTLPKACGRYDAETDSFDSTKDCVYCDELPDYTARQRYYVNAIIRDIQEDEPSKFQKKYSKTELKSGFKDGNESKAWTPIRVLSLPGGVAKKLKGLADLNKHKVGGKTKSMPISDDDYGMDIMIKFDPDAQPAQAYDIQKGEKSPLNETEVEYLHWNIEEALEKVGASQEEDTKTQKSEFKQLSKKVIRKTKDGKETTDYEESDDMAASKKSKKKGKKVEESSELEMSETSEMSEESSEAPKKKGKGKAAAKGKKKKEESSEMSEESSELEMSEEESSEAPKKKGKAAAKSKGKKKEESSEMSEESSELEMSEEESSEAPKKKGKAKSKKKEESSEMSEESSEEESSELSEESSEAPKKSSKKKRK